MNIGGKTFRVATSLCPNCGAELDACSGAGHNRHPKPGDLTVCIHCATPCQFSDEMTLDVFDPATLSPDNRRELEVAIAIVEQRRS